MTARRPSPPDRRVHVRETCSPSPLMHNAAVRDDDGTVHGIWLGDPEHGAWLEAEGDRLLEFGRASRACRTAGSAGSTTTGCPDPSRPLELWITCRMTHVYALGHLLGRPDCGGLVDHGIAALRDLFHDDVNGGWFAQVGR